MRTLKTLLWSDPYILLGGLIFSTWYVFASFMAPNSVLEQAIIYLLYVIVGIIGYHDFFSNLRMLWRGTPTTPIETDNVLLDAVLFGIATSFYWLDLAKDTTGFLEMISGTWIYVEVGLGVSLLISIFRWRFPPVPQMPSPPLS